MYCKHCGKEIADDSKFCNHCGKPQNDRNVSSKGFLSMKTIKELAITIFFMIVIVSFFIAVDSNLRSDIATYLGISYAQQEESETTNASDTDKNTVVESKIVATKKVKAEVFRIVNNHYKDTYRKEEILIDVDSEGRYFLYSPSMFYSMGAKISSINGYEYEIWCIEENGNKLVYAFNKEEMKEVKKPSEEEMLNNLMKNYEMYKKHKR